MDNSDLNLKEILQDEIKTSRQFRCLLGLSIIAASSIILIQFFPNNWVYGIAIFSSLVFLLRNRNWSPNVLSLCRSLEKKNPEIRDVVSALHELEAESNGMGEVIRHRLIVQLQTSRANIGWSPLVSSDQLNLARIVTLGFFIGLFFPVWNQVLFSGNSDDVVRVFDNIQVEVTPQDTEVEKGATVPVMAKFKKNQLPKSASLVFYDSWGNTNNVELVQNLNDPIFGGAITKIEKDLSYEIHFGNQKAGPFKIATFEFPILSRSDATISYPEYLNKEDKLVSDTLSVTANEGSKIDFDLYFNAPLKSVTLTEVPGRKKANEEGNSTLLDPISLESFAEDFKSAQWAYEVKRNARFRVDLIDQKDRKNKFNIFLNIKSIPNSPPKFKWTRPGRDIDVTPLEELALAGSVSDDLGLLNHGIMYEKPGSEVAELSLSEFAERDGESSDKDEDVYKSGIFDYVISFEDEKSEPGDLVSIAAWADDYASDGSVRRSYSDIYFVSVKSFEQILRQGQDQNQNQSQNQNQNQDQNQGQQGGAGGDLIESQKMILSGTWNTFKNGIQSNFQESMQTLVESQTELVTALETALTMLDLDDNLGELAMETAGLMNTSADKLALGMESQDLQDIRSAIPVQTKILQNLNKVFQEDEANVNRTQNQQQSQQGQGQSNRSQRMLDQLEFNENQNNYQTQTEAQSETSPEQQARLDVLDKLRDIAQRQTDLNERIQEIDAALREAETEEEKEKLRRELKKLQEEQRELMQNLDEAAQDVTETSSRDMEQTLQEMENTREAMERAQEAMENNQLTQARNEGAQAQQSVDELREEFRERSSSQFAEQMRDLSQQAQNLQQEQEEISQQIRESMQENSPELAGNEKEQELIEDLKKQKEDLENILETMQSLHEQAEEVEPLLADSIYDTLRQASQDQISEVLESRQDMVERGFLPMADQFKEQSDEAVQNLVEGVEDAVEQVLGDESAALQMASNQLRDLREELEEEVRRLAQEQQGDRQQTQEGQEPQENQSGQGNQEGQEPQENQNGRGNQEGQEPQENQNGQGNQNGQEPQENQNGQGNQEGQEPQENQSGQGNQEGQEPQENQNGQGNQEGQEPQENQSGQGNQEGQQPQQNQRNGNPNGSGNNSSSPTELANSEDLPFYMQEGQDRGSDSARSSDGPLTGDNFQQWSRDLQEIEDMVFDEELRDQAAQINDRAREIRQDFRRLGKDPQWDLVNMEILDPILQLETRINESLALERKQNSNLIPVDRDPVPAEFSKYVDEYYQRLSDLRQNAKPSE